MLADREGSEQSIDDTIKKLINDANQGLQLEAMKAINFLSKSADDSLIDKLIVYGALPVILNCAKQDLSTQVQTIAANILNNMIIGRDDRMNAVINAGALPVLRHLLGSTCIEVCQQAATAFTYIVVASEGCCSKVVNVGIVRALTSLHARFPNSLSICRLIGCILRYICKAKLCITSVKKIVLVLRSLITQPDTEVQLDILYAVVYLTDGESYQIKSNIRLIVDSDIVENIITLLDNSDVKILTVALKAIGNILTGTTSHIHCVQDNNLLPYLGHLIMHNDTLIQKAGLFCITVLLENKEIPVQAVIDAGLITNILQNLCNDNLEIKKEATWLVFYLTAIGTRDQILTLIEEGCIPNLCSMLDCSNDELIRIVLQSIIYLLEHSEELISIISSMIITCDIITTLEKLMDHENSEIKKLANDIFMQVTYAESQG